ncbi:MAG: diguanylate cyclase [Micavibrio sp.]|nr:diguanylate cyclase [Micavibrio sp.]
MRQKFHSVSFLTFSYVAALGVIALLATTRTLIEHKIIAHQEKSAQTINMAGRQRMRSQRIGWLTAVYDTVPATKQGQLHDDISRYLASMRQSYSDLSTGTLSLSPDEPLAADIRDHYFGKTQHLDADMKDFTATVEAFLASDSAAQRAKLADKIGSYARRPLIDKLDTAVDLYQANADRESARLSLMSMYSYFAVLVTLLAEALLIFRPAVKRIEQQRAELMVYAHSDPLTGGFNRHTFFDMAQTSVTTALKKDKPISVIIIGLDHFKPLNERYGQAAGDELLKEFSVTLQPFLRGDDLFGRITGDEFAIFMPGFDEEAAARVAEDIRFDISEMAFEQEGKPIPVTVSIGVAAVTVADTHPANAVQRAEKALSTARQQGRNRIVVFTNVEKDIA